VYLGGLDRNKARLAQVRNLVLAGCGTSLNASQYGAKLMREYDAFDTAFALDAAEIREHDFPRSGGGVLAVSEGVHHVGWGGARGGANVWGCLCGCLPSLSWRTHTFHSPPQVSQSGETKDVHRAVGAAAKEGLPTLSVVNAVGSLIARSTQLGCYCNAGRENAVASTKAFTTQVRTGRGLEKCREAIRRTKSEREILEERREM